MSERARVILILGAVAVVAGGAGFYFFKIYRPAQDLKNAQEEITAWEVRYQAVRDCLLGKTPGSSKTSEALAIREMAPDPWDRGTCTPLISKLVRGEAPDTGIPAVETDWTNLETAAKKAAAAFATHVSEKSAPEHDPLPGALDALDAARRKLRTTAKLSEGAGTGKALVAAQSVPLADGADRLTSLTIDTVASAHGLIAFGKTANRTVQVVLAPGAAPKVLRIGPGSFRAVPDTTWGAMATPTEVRAGALDAEGAMPSPTPLPLPDPVLAAVAGTLDDGVVIYGNQTDLVVARAKAKTLTSEPATKIEIAEAAIDTDGRAAVIWGTHDKTQGRIFHPGGADEPVVEIPALGSLCLSKDRVWGQKESVAFSFGAGRPVFQKNMAELYNRPERSADGQPVVRFDPQEIRPSLLLHGCTDDGAVFRDRASTTKYVICTDDCRIAVTPDGAPDYATVAVVGGKLVATATHGGVMGVWRETGQPTFYALAGDASALRNNNGRVMAMTDGKVIDVITHAGDSYAIVRIPAS